MNASTDKQARCAECKKRVAQYVRLSAHHVKCLDCYNTKQIQIYKAVEQHKASKAVKRSAKSKKNKNLQQKQKVLSVYQKKPEKEVHQIRASV